MAEQELFTIGEVAKMYHLSMGTLRHYEQIGLLQSEYTNPETGYRYYSVRQLEQLTNIRYLRALDLPLEEITAYIGNRDVNLIAEKLRHQKQLIVQKQQELERIERKITNRLNQIEDALDSELETVRQVKMPASRVVVTEGPVEFRSYLWLEKSIRKLEAHQKMPLTYSGKVGVSISREHLMQGAFDCYDEVFLLLDPEDEYEGAVRDLPERESLAVRFRGSHDGSPAHYARLMEAIRKKGLEAAGPSQEIALIDNSISDDPETFVTEIAVPIREKTNVGQ